MKILLVSACIAAATLGIPLIACAPDQYPPPPGQYGPPPPDQGQYQYPPAQGQYGPPPVQYGYPPPAQGQYQYPPPAQYGYPPPQYGYPPPQAYAEPVAPPGAVWVGEPGECLYAAGAVYWCAPGVVFTGFPAGWDFGRYPVVSIEPGILLDPIWFEGWRRDHPRFVFRGRIATGIERRAFIDRREEVIRNRARNPQRERERRPEERRER